MSPASSIATVPIHATAAGSTITAATAPLKMSPWWPASPTIGSVKECLGATTTTTACPSPTSPTWVSPTGSYHNQGTARSSTSPPCSRLTGPGDSFACWFWDYDNFGRLNIRVNPESIDDSPHVIRRPAWPSVSGMRPRLYRNAGVSEPFQDVTAEARAGPSNILPMGCQLRRPG